MGKELLIGSRIFFKGRSYYGIVSDEVLSDMRNAGINVDKHIKNTENGNSDSGKSKGKSRVTA